MFCLDTNVVIAVMTARGPQVRARLRAEMKVGTQLILPVIVLFELRYGAAKSERWAENNRRIDEFLTAPIEVAPFDGEDAAEAGEIRAYLKQVGAPIGGYDTLIAAQARRRGAVLVTANRREFERIPGLMVQDWSSA